MDNSHLHKHHGMHAGALPEIFYYASLLRRNMTVPERILWNFLRTKPYAYKFRRQHAFGQYVLDFYCHRAKLSIELDGASHNRKEQKRVDIARTEFVKSYGIVEMRIKDDKVLNQFETVTSEILDFLKLV